MKLYVVSKRIKNKDQFSDGLILTENDFDPRTSFFEVHKDIKPESFDYIKTIGILEDFKYIRCLIANIYWLLAPNGKLDIEYRRFQFSGSGMSVRPEDDMAYELACVFKYNIKQLSQELKDNVCFRSYVKLHSALPKDDSIDKWSFGVVNDGRNPERLEQIAESIRRQHIPHYEILICGPSTTSIPVGQDIRLLPDDDCYLDSRIPICQKKNILANAAQYNNLVIIHDRIRLTDSWYQHIIQNGNYFDAIVPSIVDAETESKHIIDCASYHEITYGKYHPFTRDPKWTSNIYMDGAVMIIKRHVYLQNPLSNFLHWGEKEDVDLAKRMKLNGFFIGINHHITVTTMTYKRKGSGRVGILRYLLRRIKSPLAWNLRRIKEHRLFVRSLQNND